MQELWESELTPIEENVLLQKAADAVAKRRMEVPAIMVLEMYKPLAYVGASAAVAFSPFLVPFFGFNTVNDYSRLLRTRDNIEALIQRLEGAKPDTPSKEQAGAKA